MLMDHLHRVETGGVHHEHHHEKPHDHHFDRHHEDGHYADVGRRQKEPDAAHRHEGDQQQERRADHRIDAEDAPTAPHRACRQHEEHDIDRCHGSASTPA
jgi:hypothetical protein